VTPERFARAEALIETCKARGLTLATAESCTGGLVASLLTEVAGSSAVVDRGFVTYSNAAKAEMLGVPPDLIAAEGAVSEPVARAMAEGARERAGAALAVSITGIAGPGGATPTKPVGLVHFGLAAAGRATTHRRREFGDLGRAEVRWRAVDEALSMLEAALRDQAAGTP
jgi:nicotinamide-nucleotide amidase